MALTPIRWAGLAVAGMLIACIAVLSPRDYYDRFFEMTPAERALNAQAATSNLHARRVSQLVRQYRMLQLADSFRAATRRAGHPAIHASYAPNVDPRTRPAFDSAVAVGAERVGPNPRIGVEFAVLMDTTRVAGYRAFPQQAATPVYILPERAGETCVVAVPLGKEAFTSYVTRSMSTDDARIQSLGPCAYYAAFGMPGPKIYEWLRMRGATFAFGGSWTQQASSESPNVDAWVSRAFNSVYWPSAPQAYFEYSTRGIECAGGNADECEKAVLERFLPGSYGYGLGIAAHGPAIRLGYSFGPASRASGAEFGGRETELLADMVRALGRERFERFWTSTEPVPAAFERASGMRLGAWVSGWAAERVERIEHGPTIRAAGLISGLGIAAICVFVGLASARRREFA